MRSVGVTKSVRTGIVLVFLLYLMILTKEILFKYIYILESHEFGIVAPSWRSSNFVPLKTIYFYLFLADVNTNIKIQNLAGNVIGFVPLGFLLPLLSRGFWKLRQVLAAAFLLSLAYEVAQMYTGLGSFDVDDLILNTLGGWIGYCLITVLFWVSKPFQKGGKKK